jgi:hypothetical protein
VLRDTLRDEAGDVEALGAHVESLLPGATGAAIFARAGGELIQSLVTAAPVTNDVSVGSRARLLPLARLADGDNALVGLADSNTLRIFALRSGTLVELGILDDEPDEYTLTEAGGWSQARFQRHVEEHREAFADIAAEALHALAARENATVLVLAGDEVAIPLLRDALPRPLADMLRGTVRCELRATADEVTAVCLPELERIRAEDAHDAADRLIGAAEADGMGIVGAEETRRALELGQVQELVLDSGPDAELLDETAEDLVHLAAATDARIRFAEHAGLRQREGVGGVLRFRLDRAANQPRDEADAEVAATVSATGRPMSGAGDS